jgi:hypothetical protein
MASRIMWRNKLLEMDKRHHTAFDELEEENNRLHNQVSSLNKIVDRLTEDRGGNINIEVQEEITNLYDKKKLLGARLEQAMEKIAELEAYVYETQDMNKNKLSSGDIISLRHDLSNKIEDLKLRQDQDLAHSNNRLIKIIDDMQLKIDELDKSMDNIEHRRQNGEKNILQRATELLRAGNIEGDVNDIKRRLNELEMYTYKPKEKSRSINLENEEIIKDIVSGMAGFEREINDIKVQLANQDRDIQDAAKLIHELDVEKTKNNEYISNLMTRTDDLENLYEVVKKERQENTKNLEELRLAAEQEFNDVKRAEITDFKNLNTKINELIVLQDVVEQLADQVDYMQKEIDGVRKIRDHTPVKMNNKVGIDNLTSSMSPNTVLATDMKNRQTSYTDTTYKTMGRDNLRGRNLLQDLVDKKSSPSSRDIRESLLLKSRLSRHLQDKTPDKKRDYIQIGAEEFHKSDLPNKLRDDSPGDGVPKKRRRNILIFS